MLPGDPDPLTATHPTAFSAAALRATHTIDSAEPAFISWRGVTQYLSPTAINHTLLWAASLPTGSEIVLSFLESNAQAETLKGTMAETGLTIESTFTESEMTSMLSNAGFHSIEHLTPEIANDRYFNSRSDVLRAPEIQRLVSAKV